jgi:hypothetical protein
MFDDVLVHARLVVEGVVSNNGHVRLQSGSSNIAAGFLTWVCYFLVASCCMAMAWSS